MFSAMSSATCSLAAAAGAFPLHTRFDSGQGVINSNSIPKVMFGELNEGIANTPMKVGVKFGQVDSSDLPSQGMLWHIFFANSC